MEIEQDNFAIGLDLGTTNSCIGVYRNGQVEIIPNSINEKTTPSIVTILDDKVLVGEEALEQSVEMIDNSILEIKRLIGRKIEEKNIKENFGNWQYQIVEAEKNKGAAIELTRKGKKVIYTPEEISSFIIKKMVGQVENHLNLKVNKLVISVPAYFNDSQRNQTKRAAEMLGLTVLRVINEPTAAALAFGLEKEILFEAPPLSNEFELLQNEPKELISSNLYTISRYILVFDLGGGTFDVSLLYLDYSDNNKIFEVKAVSGDTHLGGEDFDYKLSQYFFKSFCNKNNISENSIKKSKKLLKKLKLSSENIKKILSYEKSTVINLPNFYDDFDLLETITRELFEDLCKDLFERLIIPLETVLKDSKISPANIDEVILVGGSTKMPKIKEILSKYFPTSRINDTINPEESVAIGATLVASQIVFKKDIFSGFNLLDITPLSLGIEIKNNNENEEINKLGKLMSVIIPRGKRIPIQLSKDYYTCYDNQTCVRINIYEGEKKYTKNNHLLGSLSLYNLAKKLKGEVKVTVTFVVDINGILTVKAVESSKGQEGIKIINDKFDLTREEMEKLKIKNQDDYNKLNPKKLSNDFKKLKDALKIYLHGYENSEDDEDKYNSILNYAETLEEFIESFLFKPPKTEKKASDEKDILFYNEALTEKYYKYLSDLFTSYTKVFNLKEQLEKSTEKEKINQIKKYLELFIQHNLGYFYKLLDILKKIPEKNFYEILIFCLEKVNYYGSNCLIENRPFSRYQSMIYFEQSIKIMKTYITDSTIPSNIDKNLLYKYIEQKEITNHKLDDIFSGAIFLLEKLNKLQKIKLGTNPGCSKQTKRYFSSKRQEKEAFECLLKNFEANLNEIQSQKTKNPSIEEAFLIYNIIRINWIELKNERLNIYLKMAEECEKIALNVGLIKKKDWYQDFLELDKSIKEKKGERNVMVLKMLEEFKKENSLIFNEIDENYNKGKNNFICYILRKYPYAEFEVDLQNKIKDFNNYNEELIKYLSQKYFVESYELYLDSESELREYCIMNYIHQKINSLSKS